jgi:hypothetical protein
MRLMRIIRVVSLSVLQDLFIYRARGLRLRLIVFSNFLPIELCAQEQIVVFMAVALKINIGLETQRHLQT